MEIFIIEGDGNQPERSKQGHILRVLRQVKDVFSRMKCTYILLLETSQESQGHFQEISISFELDPKVI